MAAQRIEGKPLAAAVKQRVALEVEQLKQRGIRPCLAVILVGAFTELPLLEESSRLWDLLEIGLGGYIVGRFKTRK